MLYGNRQDSSSYTLNLTQADVSNWIFHSTVYIFIFFSVSISLICGTKNQDVSLPSADYRKVWIPVIMFCLKCYRHGIIKYEKKQSGGIILVTNFIIKCNNAMPSYWFWIFIPLLWNNFRCWMFTVYTCVGRHVESWRPEKWEREKIGLDI